MILLFLMSSLPVVTTDLPIEKFADVEIERSFKDYLLANPLLMEVTGVKIIRLSNGQQVVLAVASTVLKGNSARERLQAEKVCRLKALTSVLAEKQGIQIARVEQVIDTTVIVLENGKETGKSVEEVMQVTRSKVEGIIKDIPVVGRWRSKGGDVFYLALGIICDNRGEPIRGKK